MVEAAERLHRPTDRLGHLVLVADVAHQGKGPAAGLFDQTDALRQVLGAGHPERWVVPRPRRDVDQGHGGPLPGQGHGVGATLAPRRAGDEHDLAGEASWSGHGQ